MARRARRPQEAPGLFDAPVPEERTAGGADAERASPAPARSEPRRLTVSALTGAIGSRLGELGRLAVEGELSGLRRHTSGHVYFDLKDEGARIGCVVWRSRAERALRVEPEEGMKLVAHGRLDVYAPRGSYSLVVDRLEPLGAGALLAQLEALKAELRGLGWFDRRRALPEMAHRIGVVTSRDGAALRDFLRTRSLRWPGYPLRLCHTSVQGPGAALEIADAIARLDASGVDLIVVCRGGGSLEDLWAFNERAVAEAIWNASVPVVTGIGHESDTTLADHVADHRAHTPTDAAQAVVPDRRALEDELWRHGNHLIEAIDRHLHGRRERLAALAGRPVLRRADWILDGRAAALASHRARLSSALDARVLGSGERLRALQVRLERESPALRVERARARVSAVHQRLRTAGLRRLERAEHGLGLLSARIHGASPLQVLARGYSLTSRPGETVPLRDAADVAVGDEVSTRLARGRFRAEVVDVEPAEEDGEPS
jgi:exodeoxyribonuclease VII large subunit